MNPKTLQYLMGHSDIGVTMNTCTHLGLEDATEEVHRIEELRKARDEIDEGFHHFVSFIKAVESDA